MLSPSPSSSCFVGGGVLIEIATSLKLLAMTHEKNGVLAMTTKRGRLPQQQIASQ